MVFAWHKEMRYLGSWITVLFDDLELVALKKKMSGKNASYSGIDLYTTMYLFLCCSFIPNRTIIVSLSNQYIAFKFVASDLFMSLLF